MSSSVAHEAACIFCKIIKGEIPSFKLIETTHSYSFLDIQPTAEAHALVIPKYHAAKLHNVPDEYLTDTLTVAKRIVQAIGCDKDGPDGPGYNILQNNGRIAHQEVDHVHFHVIPKTAVDSGLIIEWPAHQADFDKLAQLHKKLTNSLSNL
ncbi:adenosine 5'-monophosphoramidase Ecym_8036 [Eremothecium cymbalariae DBVPG|uniref:HIT domain-containing protein n=1 Tax=Eremothecium cymbalariae (strain CBS 270.75 / DBVPG 7215 / KCTC 17166 / NRRL Y-17582) TaxID=931890 RepID=G8JWV8_ERECY|nr:Hypothetical protein Ecym_8036 [Eremothecium cymbalariae DBVPG\